MTQPDEFVSTEGYRERFNSIIGSLYIKKQLNIILDILKHVSAKKILEIGAGHGQVCNSLFNLGFEIECVVSTEDCKKFINPEIKTYVNPILKYIPEREYDCIIALKTLGHTDDPNRFVRNICGHSKYVIVDYPSSFSFARFYKLGYHLKRIFEKNLREFFPQSPKEIELLFRINNYKKVSSSGLFTLPILFYRLINSPSLIEEIERKLKFIPFKSPVIECYSSI